MALGAVVSTKHASIETFSQPAVIDGFHLVGDVRLYHREDLRKALKAAGAKRLDSVSDAALVLQSYMAWGEECLQKMVGDFSFVVWNSNNNTLFVARDHFGAKPLYYAQSDRVLLVSNHLAALRAALDEPLTLNDAVVYDFLMFGRKFDAQSTFFSKIKKLPSLHCLTIKDRTVRSRAYWSLPTSQSIRYRRPDEYVEHFRELLFKSIDERTRGLRTSVLMSGGRDSTAVAAVLDRLSNVREPIAINVYRKTLDDPERHYAGLMAERLRMPVKYLAIEDLCQTEEPFDWRLSPEPNLFYRSSSLPLFQQLARTHDVVLHGEGSDEILIRECLVDLVKVMPWSKLAYDIALGLLLYRRRPAICLPRPAWLVDQSNLRTGQIHNVLDWFPPETRKRLDLDDRWAMTRETGFNHRHLIRKNLHTSLRPEYSDDFYEALDPGATCVDIEARTPFMDRHLVEFMAQISPLPWCIDKTLLSEALAQEIPKSIHTRRKTGCVGDWTDYQFKLPDGCKRFLLEFTGGLSNYIDQRRMPECVDLQQDTDQKHLIFHWVLAAILGQWLDQHSNSVHL